VVKESNKPADLTWKAVQSAHVSTVTAWPRDSVGCSALDFASYSGGHRFEFSVPRID